ncbi:MAG: cobalamin-binding protein [Candidatus Lokiarchaeota archaeon]|nr:cobalamin-binding protein [Candidatus Lokiarchaeota archaeon]
MTDTLTGITNAIIELDVDSIKDLVKAALDAKVPASDIMKAATKGMDEVGKRYERKEYYLTELVLAGEIMKEAFEVLAPALKTEGKASSKGKIVMATVRGDQHDIGKNILKSLLVSKGFEILDLGMDVDASKVVATVKETGARVVALSSLLTMTVDQIKAVHEALVAAGLRNDVKLIVGGAPLNMGLAKKLGADTYADDATSGVKEIEHLFSI